MRSTFLAAFLLLCLAAWTPTPVSSPLDSSRTEDAALDPAMKQVRQTVLGDFPLGRYSLRRLSPNDNLYGVLVCPNATLQLLSSQLSGSTTSATVGTGCGNVLMGISYKFGTGNAQVWGFEITSSGQQIMKVYNSYSPPSCPSSQQYKCSALWFTIASTSRFMMMGTKADGVSHLILEGNAGGW